MGGGRPVSSCLQYNVQVSREFQSPFPPSLERRKLWSSQEDRTCAPPVFLYSYISFLPRAGYLTLYGNESKDYDDASSRAKDVAHSLEVYNEFYKLDRFLMKAARSMLSAGWCDWIGPILKERFDKIHPLVFPSRTPK